MDDKRIEEMIRESCDGEMPQGMKDRVMRAARQELAHQSHPRKAIRWQPVFVSLALAIVLLTNVMDGYNQARVARLTDGNSRSNEYAPINLQQILQIRNAEALLSMYSGGEIAILPIGDDLL